MPYESIERLLTDDGAVIELRRIPRAQQPTADLPPVLVVHGVASNHRNQDAHPDNSLARHMAGIGRDVWVVTLRSGLGRRLLSRFRMRFEDMARNDVPLAVRAVLERTGASQLDYAGFSMGGMLLYAALGRGVDERMIRRVVLVGSPGRIIAPIAVPHWFRRIPSWIVPTLRLRWLALFVAFMSEWFPTILHRVVLNPANMSPGMTRLALANCIEDVPSELHADFLHWASGDGTVTVGSQPLLDRIHSVCIPALFVAGSADHIAPVAAVHHAFEAWGSECPDMPKRFMVLGRDLGVAHDYGHGDLAMGAQIANDLFVTVARFLGPEHQVAERNAASEGAVARRDVARLEPLPAGERAGGMTPAPHRAMPIRPDDKTPDDARTDQPRERGKQEFEREGRFEASTEREPTVPGQRPSGQHGRGEEFPGHGHEFPPEESPGIANVSEDDRIEKDVRKLVAGTIGLDPKLVQVAVRGGNVTLEGAVANSASVEAAGHAAASVHGVTSVTNRLREHQPKPGS